MSWVEEAFPEDADLLGVVSVHKVGGMETEITVVDGVDGLTPDMLRVRHTDKEYIEYWCLLCNAREYIWTDASPKEVIARHTHNGEIKYKLREVRREV